MARDASLARNQLGDGMAFLAPHGGGIAVIGDAFAAVPGLEGAYLSGVAMAEQLAQVPELRALPI
jgi:predicted NAD/FAD-dependent oxidoreductase